MIGNWIGRKRLGMRLVRLAALTLTAVVILMMSSLTATLAANTEPINVYIFWQKGCPYCASAKAVLEDIRQDRPEIALKSIEITESGSNENLYEAILSHFEIDQAVVPIVIIGGNHFVGFADQGRSAAGYLRSLDDCLARGCPNVVAALQSGLSSSLDTSQRVRSNTESSSVPGKINLPVVGTIDLASLSLPLLTIVLAAIDGFNPCAMWVLVFLISLLLGLEDERRMWLLGGVFLATTALMYFAVMSAWFNLIQFLGATGWLRMAIACLAIVAGLLFLRDYWTKPDAACKVVRPDRRRKIMDNIRRVVGRENLLWSLIGIAILAVGVNFIELACSAGVPAVFTQMLALNDLTNTAYYAYISLYVLVFMLDDVAIFATAMIALRISGLTTSYTRYSHLIGGLLLLTIGAVMLLRPELLSFL
jgi:glutaredoxin